jgi:hypothetical protein
MICILGRYKLLEQCTTLEVFAKNISQIEYTLRGSTIEVINKLHSHTYECMYTYEHTHTQIHIYTGQEKVEKVKNIKLLLALCQCYMLYLFCLAKKH